MAKELIFIRHTSLSIPRGICYGHSNIDVSSNFNTEAEHLKSKLAHFVPDVVISSPLKRCVKLATYLFDNKPETKEKLKEVNYGDWEEKSWVDIAVEGGNLWMYKNTLNSPPNGESFAALKRRVVEELQNILERSEENIAIVCHGGVIRSVLSYLLKTPLEDTRSYHIHYTGFVKFINTEEGWRLSEFNSAAR